METTNENITVINKKFDCIIELLSNLNTRLDETNDKIEIIENKLNNLSLKIDKEVLEECQKMGGHIDFIEEVYDNVKYPLGYICKKVKNLIGNSEHKYTLKNLSDENDIIK
tara:strand:- start:128 stop:460 length:333 start_codon:yes stop_codon:yes gene_type:complete